MAKKRKVWLHVGVGGAGDVIEAALAHHHRALAELGCASLAHTTTESFLAAVEMLGTRKEWDLKRADVEGRWAGMVERGRKSRVDVVFSQPMLAGATRDRIALMVDALDGYQVNVVVTTGSGEESSAVERWSTAVRKPERLHVLEVQSSPEATWKAFGRLVGFGTASLPLDGVPAVTPPVGSLADARVEIEHLARRNAALEIRLEELDRKRKKLKRRLRRATGDDQAA